MSLTTTSSNALFLGNGSIGPFPFSFKFNKHSDITVYKTDLAGNLTQLSESAGYSLSANAGNLGGSVTLVGVLNLGECLNVMRILALDQQTTLPDGGPFFSSTIEKTFDNQAMMLQQVAEAMTRAVRLPLVSSVLPELATPTPRGLFAWNSNGTAIEYLLTAPAYVSTTVSASSYGSDLSAAIAAIGSSNVLLVVNSPITVNNNAATHANTQIIVQRPGLLTVAAGKTLTINGPFSAGLYQTFAGTGSISFGPGSVESLVPHLFGSVDSTGAVSSQAAFTKMVATMEISTVGKVSLPAGTYKANIHTYTFQAWEGAGVGITKLIPADSTTPILWVSSSAKTYSYNEGVGFSARGFTIDGKQAPGVPDSTGALTGQHGVYLDGGVWLDTDTYPGTQPHPQASIGLIDLRNIHITGCSGHGLFMDGTNHGTAHNANSAMFTQVAWVDINNVQSTWNKGNGIRIEGTTYQTHIGGGCLVEKNGAWIAAGALGVKNERAQLFIGAANNGFNYNIVIDGGATFQSTGLYANMTTAETCGISINAGQNIQINGAYIEQNTRGIYTSGGTTTRTIAIIGTCINTSYVAGIDFQGGTGLRAEGNYFTNGAYGTAIRMNPAGGPGNIDSINISDNTYVGFIDSTHYYDLHGSVKWVKLQDKGKTERPIKYYVPVTTITIDLDSSDIHYVNMDGTHDITSVTFTGTPIVGRLYTIGIWQGSIGGHLVSGWPVNVKWANSPAGNVAPALSTTLYRGDIYGFRYNQNGSFYQETMVQNVPV